VVSVIALISIGITFVTFELMESSGTWEAGNNKLAGAAAGFVIICTVLMGMYFRLDKRHNLVTATQIGIMAAERIIDEAGNDVTGVKTKYYDTMKYFRVIFKNQGKDWNKEVVIQLKAKIEKSFSDRYNQSIDLSEQPEAILQAEELV